MNLKYKVKEFIQVLLSANAIIDKIIRNIQESGGTSYLIGGSVRDILMAKNLPYVKIKDLDIEVHGIDIESLKNILSKYGHVNLVGKSFGVLRLSNLNVDWSLPRTDSIGRKPDVKIDPNMDINQALKRRDLTINSIAINLNNFDIIDPFGGIQDIENKTLKATDENLFKDDPLRFFRVMQFVSRFSMIPDKKLNQICFLMDLKSVSKERIELEFEKMLLKSKTPSLGLRWLLEINRLKDIFPELYKTVGVVQEYKWHPEKDVFEHTMQALDAAARLCSLSFDTPSHRSGTQDERKQESCLCKKNIETKIAPARGECSSKLCKSAEECIEPCGPKDKLILLYAAICHDLGKPDTTKTIDGVIKSHGHEVVGVEISKQFLKRITTKKDLIDTVLKLVRHHMAPGTFVKQNASLGAYKRLAIKLSPETNIEMLTKLAFADRAGRNGKSHEPLDIVQSDNQGIQDIREFLDRAKQAQVFFDKEQPVLLGRDFLDVLSTGPELGKAVKMSYEIQINESINDKEKLKKLVLDKLGKK